MENIIEIFKNAGYDVSDMSNKQKSIQNINKVLANDKISIKVCSKGRIWTSQKSGKKFNAYVSGYGKQASTYNKDLSPMDILQILGIFLKDTIVRDNLKLNLSTPYKCHKCDGKGIIPSFSWYADGVCFACMGAGMVGNYNLSKIAKELPRLNPKEITNESELNKIILVNDKRNLVDGVRQDAFERALELGFIQVINEPSKEEVYKDMGWDENGRGIVEKFVYTDDKVYKWESAKNDEKWYHAGLNKFFIG